MLVEHARSLLGIDDAVHAESSADGTAVVSPLRCSLMDVDVEVALTAGTRLAALHGGLERVSERATCNYGLDPRHAHVASTAGMVVSATDDTGEVRAVERDDHPFFVATLYQPQLRSTAASPHPVWVGLLEAAHERAAARQRP